MAAQLRVSPSRRCLQDEPVHVRVEGLSPRQEVTLSASLQDDSGELFRSFAYYRAASSGELDLRVSAALGGSYSGVEPMGLLWALESQTPHKQLAKRNVLTPFRVTYGVHEGRGVAGRLLDSCTTERWFLGEGVRRIPVREGRLKATLFLPPGPGPFPGLIDLYGTGGGLVEHRASLLASRGFVTLALAYMAYEGLPFSPEFLELEYFGEAVEFLRNQQQVKMTGIGVLGLSKGADLALALATFWPGLKAAVSISGIGVNSNFPLRVKGLTIPAHPSSLARTKDSSVAGSVELSEIMDDPRDPATWASRIPVEKSLAKFLFISGQDDKICASERFCREVVGRLQRSGRPVEFYCYPGAGHLLQPPYLPLCCFSSHRSYGFLFSWGGKRREHAKAQEDAWQRILAFFRQHLQDSPTKSNL